MSMLEKILIICSGGDAPGMNAAVRAITRTAIHHGIEVFGCQGGYQGLIEQRIMPLSSASVANIIQRGGTILQTGRSALFHQQEIRAQCCNFLQHKGIQALVVLGGDGSFRGAMQLEKEGGPQTIGIPCTIDNDIVGTEYSIGFDTACNTALEAIDKIRDTAFSLGRNFLVEVMGRASGFLAVEVGMAGGAEFILIPEVPDALNTLMEEIQRPDRHLKSASIIVVAEADQAGRSFHIAQQIKAKTGVEYKVCVLGHTQRGGSPTIKDRNTATLMGYHAVGLLKQGVSQHMVALQKGTITSAPFPDPSLTARAFTQQELLHINSTVN